MKKIPKQEYTAEFEDQAVKHAQAVVVVVAAKELGLVEQTLRCVWTGGSQDASQARAAKLTGYEMTPSMSRKGDGWDNAPTERFFNSLKNERVHGTTYATRADAQADLFEYIEVFCNRKRRHATLGDSSPVRFLENWISEHAAQQALAAWDRHAGRRNSTGTSAKPASHSPPATDHLRA